MASAPKKQAGDLEMYSAPPEQFIDGPEVRASVNRRLGVQESLFEEGQRLYGYMINVNYILVSSGRQLTTENIKSALKKLQRRITALRLIITGAGRTRFFNECTNLDIDFEILSTYDWKAIFEQQLKVKFPEGQPLWRVRLLRPEPLMTTNVEKLYYPFVFAYNHAIVDSGSIMYGINKYFLDYLEETVSGGIEDPVCSMPFPEPRECTLPEAQTTEADRMGWACLFKSCICCVVPERTNPLVEKLFRKYRPSRPVGANGLVDFVLSAEDTTAVSQSCKRHGIKVSGLLTAAVAVATYKLLQDYEIIEGGKVTFPSATLVNIRRFADPPIPDEHVGLLNSFCYQKIKVSNAATDVNTRPFWVLSKKCHDDVQRMIENGHHFRLARMTDSVFLKYGPEAAFEVDNLKKREFFAVTNLGNFDVRAKNRENPTVCLEKTLLGCADFMVGDALFTHTLCTLNGQLQWSLCYSKLLVTKTFAREYADIIKRTIIHASQC